MEQVAQLPTRKESATQGDGLGDRDPGEDDGVRLNARSTSSTAKPPGSPNFPDDEKGNGVHYTQPKFGKEMPP